MNWSVGKWRAVVSCLAMAVVLATSCTKPQALPDLPSIETATFTPAVRRQVESAVAAVRAKPRDAALNGRLGMTLHANSQFVSAESCYRRAHLLERSSSAWAYYLGVVLSEQGKYQPAVTAFTETLRLRPDYLPAELHLARDLASQGQLPESRKAYERILRNHADDATAYYGLGRVLAASGDTEDAAKSYQRACELFPAYGVAHYALAGLDRSSGKPQEAQKHLVEYQRHMQDVPPFEDPLLSEIRKLRTDPQELLARSIELDQSGKVEQALAANEEALSIDPRLAQAHVNLISLYARLGQPGKAEDHYRAAIAIDPNLADAHYNYGVLLFSQAKRSDAKTAFLRTLEINPNHPGAHNNLGLALEQEGRVAEAIQQYRIAIENRPGYRLAHYHLGRALANLRRYDEAIQEFKSTLTPEDQNTPTYTYALAIAYARSGDSPAANRYFQKAHQEASALGQSNLVASIENALRTMAGSRAR